MILELALGGLGVAFIALGFLYIGTLRQFIDLREKRIAVLERQVDDLHGLSITPDTNHDSPEQKIELPQEIAQFISGFEDADDREEYSEYIQSRLARGADALEIAREFEV